MKSSRELDTLDAVLETADRIGAFTPTLDLLAAYEESESLGSRIFCIDRSPKVIGQLLQFNE